MVLIVCSFENVFFLFFQKPLFNHSWFMYIFLVFLYFLFLFKKIKKISYPIFIPNNLHMNCLSPTIFILWFLSPSSCHGLLLKSRKTMYSHKYIYNSLARSGIGHLDQAITRLHITKAICNMTDLISYCNTNPWSRIH